MLVNYWIRQGDNVQGPFSADRIRDYVATGKVRANMLVSTDQINWRVVGDVPELQPGAAPPGDGVVPVARPLVPGEVDAPEPIPDLVPPVATSPTPAGGRSRARPVRGHPTRRSQHAHEPRYGRHRRTSTGPSWPPILGVGVLILVAAIYLIANSGDGRERAAKPAPPANASVPKTSDYAAYEAAQSTAWTERTPTPLLEYLVKHPQGKHRADAKKVIEILYGHASTHYQRVALKRNGAESLVEGLAAAIKSLGKQDRRVLKVAIQGRHDTEVGPGQAGLERRLNGLRTAENPLGFNILNYGDSFRLARVRHREQMIFGFLKTAVAKMFEEDVVRVERVSHHDPHHIRIAYRVYLDGTYYVLKNSWRPLRLPRGWSLSLGLVRGIASEWTLSVTPIGGKAFAPLKFTAWPPRSISYAKTLADPSWAAYDALLGTVFRDHAIRCVRSLGLPEPPPPPPIKFVRDVR